MTKTVSIAVSGVGGGVGQSIIKALSKANYHIIGMDGEVLGTGLYAVHKGYQIPYAHEPDFIERVLDICLKEKCRLYFPGLDAELPILSKSIERFRAIGTTVIVSTPEVVEICDNKLLTFRFLSKNNITVPKTLDLGAFLKSKKALVYPIILKPKKGGARSKNVFLLKHRTDLDTILAYKDFTQDNFIVQEYIKGDEYTCGTINLDGRYLGTIIMRRILRDGDTYKCFVVKNKIIEKVIKKLMNILKPFGACNVQLRLKDNIPYILEINARCSGTTAARALAGFNEPKMMADYLVYGKYPIFQMRKISVLRYWKELVVENNKIKVLEKEKHITNKPFIEL